MRIGIFGGTFDPIHLGHLALAEQCREQCELDEVWFVPAAQPPHKLNETISLAKHRRQMVEFAISGNSSFKVNSIELERAGPSYTVTTLEHLNSEDPSRELFLLVGADSIRDLPHWRNPSRILELSTIVAVNRGESPEPDCSELRAIGGGATKILHVHMPPIDLSATDIRCRVKAGKSIRYLVPRSVEVYIQQQDLYRTMSEVK